MLPQYQKDWRRQDRINHPEKYEKIDQKNYQREKDSGKKEAYDRQYYLDNKEKIKAQVAKRRNDMRAHGYDYRERNVSAEDVKRFWEDCARQEGKCAICGEVGIFRGKPQLVLDHNHSTGEYRGAICDACNKALGLFKDNILALERAITYLRTH